MTFMGYTVWPMKALNEMRKLMDCVKLEIPSIKCPALLMHSKADLLAPIENIEYVYDNLSSKHKEKKMVENAGHNIFMSLFTSIRGTWMWPWMKRNISTFGLVFFK